MGLIDDLGRGPVGIDTAPFIYLLEEHARYLPLVEPLFQQADQGVRTLVTSALTLLELLVVPYRLGHRALGDRYERLLLGSRGIQVADISRDQLRAAAQLRAVTGVKTPDALQLAAALAAECKTYVTNDRRLPAIPGIRVVQLADYVG